MRLFINTNTIVDPHHDDKRWYLRLIDIKNS